MKQFEKYIFHILAALIKIEIKSKSYNECVYKISRSFIKYFRCFVRLMVNMREISL